MKSPPEVFFLIKEITLVNIYTTYSYQGFHLHFRTQASRSSGTDRVTLVLGTGPQGDLVACPPLLQHPSRYISLPDVRQLVHCAYSLRRMGGRLDCLRLHFPFQFGGCEPCAFKWTGRSVWLRAESFTQGSLHCTMTWADQLFCLTPVAALSTVHFPCCCFSSVVAL